MDIGAIGTASIGMHLAQAQQSAGIAVMKKAMGFEESQAAALIEDLRQAVPASFGQRLDVLA